MGLQILKNGESIKSSTNPSCVYELKAVDDGLEVIHLILKKDSLIICQPYECDKATNVYYILDGLLEYQKDKSVLYKGDSFSVKDIEESEFFKVLEDSKLLWIVSSKVYENLALENKGLDDLLCCIQDKDHYTKEHCHRVGRLTKEVARRVGLSEEKIVNTILAALCHDVGKINVPIEILNKPGMLTREEFEIIKKHTTDGYKTVCEEMRENIAEIVLQHHERLNGSGYPYGKKGDEIMLEAKVIAVIDSYDAIISDRPYKNAISPSEALQELKRCVGTHYEKEIVDKLEEVLIEDGVI